MKKQVLFVDDEPSILSILASLFRLKGYASFTTTDGAEALSIVAAEKVRVCFVDLRMPVMDGVELCRRIREIDPSAKVFALSAFVDAYTPEQFRKAGFAGFFRKPFKADELTDGAGKAFAELEQEQSQAAS